MCNMLDPFKSSAALWDPECLQKEGKRLWYCLREKQRQKHLSRCELSLEEEKEEEKIAFLSDCVYCVLSGFKGKQLAFKTP